MERPKSHRSAARADLVSSDVLDRCRSGDQAAWAELVHATHRDVYTLCLRILRNPDDAADATQDAYVKAWRGLRGFRGEAMFSTWLYRVATNAALSKQRSLSRRRSHEVAGDDELLAQFAGTGSTEAEAGAKLDVQDLERALAGLPELYRAAVVCRDVYGMSIGEIADQLNISQTAAKVRVHRGRKKLKEWMFPAGTEVEDGS